VSGKAINSEQVRVYMQTRKYGKKQVTAAAKAGISERSGSRIEKGNLQPGNKRKRYWRTRVDPFADVWDSEILPLLEKNHKLTPITLFEKLQKDHPGKYQDSKLRTFQRRVSKWKALHGPDKEVMFRQEQVVKLLLFVETNFSLVKKLFNFSKLLSSLLKITCS